MAFSPTIFDAKSKINEGVGAKVYANPPVANWSGKARTGIVVTKSQSDERLVSFETDTSYALLD